MTFGNQGGDIENRIVTVWETVGDKKVEAAIARIQARQNQAQANIKKNAKEAETAADRLDKAFVRLNRNAALEKIERGFIRAAKSGENFDQVLRRLEKDLERVGASQAEVNRITEAGERVRRGLIQPLSSRGGGSNFNLRAIGTDIRNLPAVQIPGTGISTDVVGKVLASVGRLNIGLGELATTGLIAAAAAVALNLSIKAFKAAVGDVQDQIISFNKIQREVAVILATGTPQDIVSERERVQKELDGLIVSTNTAGEQMAAALENLTGQGALGQLIVTIEQMSRQGVVGEATQAFIDGEEAIRNTKQRLDELNAAYEENQRLLEAQRVQARQEANLDSVRQFELGLTSATPDALKERIKFLEQEKALLDRDINTYVLSEEKHEEYISRMNIIDIQIGRINDTLLPAAENAEKLANAEQYLKDQRKELIDLTEKFNDDIAKLEDQAAQQRLDIQQRYNDRLIDLAVKAADAAEDALRKLEQKRDDLALDLARDQNDEAVKFQQEQLDAQIEFQRDEAKAARDHADTLKEIDRRAKSSSLKAIQDRDAIALLAAEEEKTQAIESAQEQFDSERREREIAYRDTLSDASSQYNRERQQRMLKYQRDLEDAAAQYNRELEQQAISNARSLRDLETQTAREKALLESKHAIQEKLIRDAYAQELQIIAMAQGARLKQEAQFQNMLYMQARRAMMGLSQAPTTFAGGPTRTMAVGGNLDAWRTAEVNEIRRESTTNRRGRTIALPEGRGWFTPAEPVRVNQTAGTGSIALTLNVGDSRSETRTVSREEARRIVGEVLGVA